MFNLFHVDNFYKNCILLNFNILEQPLCSMSNECHFGSICETTPDDHLTLLIQDFLKRTDLQNTFARHLVNQYKADTINWQPKKPNRRGNTKILRHVSLGQQQIFNKLQRVLPYLYAAETASHCMGIKGGDEMGHI